MLEEHVYFQPLSQTAHGPVCSGLQIPHRKRFKGGQLNRPNILIFRLLPCGGE